MDKKILVLGSIIGIIIILLFFNNYEKMNYTIYLADENVEKFDVKIIEKESKNSSQILMDILYENQVFSEKVKVLSFENNNGVGILDLSKEFKNVICYTGTTGEYFIMGSIVNSFLDTYNLEEIIITINGEGFSTGHSEYYTPLKKYE